SCTMPRRTRRGSPLMIIQCRCAATLAANGGRRTPRFANSARLKSWPGPWPIHCRSDMAALRVRRKHADLSSDDRKRYAAAVKEMKRTGAYDRYVSMHQNSMAGSNMWAHQLPGFPPWHRQFILDFENDLRTADSNLHGGAASDLTLPYWDWLNYHGKKRFLWWGKIWSSDFMGGDGDSGDQDKVKDGPFQAGQFTMFYDPNVPPELGATPFLRRRLGKDVGSL